MTIVRPPALHRGAKVHIAAPSGPVPRDRFDAGLARLKACLPDVEIELAANLEAEEGYFAGDDRTRLKALQAALADPSIDAIIAARGGYGISRLLGQLDPAGLRRAPKTLVGFSDCTALLCWALTKAEMASIHGPVITQLGGLDDEDLDHFLELLRGEEPRTLVAEEGAVLHGGRVQGRLIGGNLEVLRSLLGTPYFPDLRGAILAIEEIGERPYRIDRCLTQLMSSGALRGVRGIAVGQLIGCGEPASSKVRSPSAHSVVVERLEGLGIPVVTGFPFGHDFLHNAALPHGSMVELLADAAALYFLEPATEARATH